MANYRYLGYGITNENGIAKLDHDANGNPIDHSYTGTGAGELDIIASLDDNEHISDSSLQSEPYPVIDAIFYDKATNGTGEKNTNWFNSGVTATPTATGTTLSGSGAFYMVNTENGSALSTIYFFEPPFAVEFDVPTYTNGRFGVKGDNESNEITPHLKNDWGVLGGEHLKIEVTNSKVIPYVDGVEKTNITRSTSAKNRVGFVGNLDMTYANFKLYPI